MIKISELNQIQDPTEFFNTDKILYCDVVDVTKAPKQVLRQKIVKQNLIRYRNRRFWITILIGSPENLLKKKTYSVGNFGCMYYDGDIGKAIQDGHVFEFSDYYYRKDRAVDAEHSFVIQRYIAPLYENSNVEAY